MTPTLLRAPRRAATTALAGLALLPLAGCGGDEAATGASGDGLARLAPKTTPIYVEGAVGKDTKERKDLDALVGKFAPGKTIDGLVADALKREDSKLDYAKDIEPWLGERAGVAITSFDVGTATGSAGDADGAALVQVTDEGKAMDAVRKGAGTKLAEREYKGTAYLAGSGDDEGAAGIVDGTLVLGTEPALKAVVDTAAGDGLSSNADFEKVVDAVDDDALGFVYGDVRRLLELAGKASAGSVDAKQLEGVREYLDRQGLKTFAASAVAQESSAKFKVATAQKDTGQGDAAATTLATLPAGSWAALGLGDLGKSLSDGLDQLSALSGPGFDLQEGLDQLEQQAGIDVQKDLISWMGDAGLFVRGTSLTDIGGALVVQSKDPAATKAALAKARTLVAGGGLPARDLTGAGIDDGFSISPGNAPVEVFAALAGDRFVLAVNRAALDEAISPKTKLGDDDTLKAAGELLGDGVKPSFLLDFPKVSGLVGLAAGGEPGFAKVKPYLDKVGTIAAGSKREGDLQLQTFAVEVK